jgi:hypothetical protein
MKRGGIEEGERNRKRGGRGREEGEEDGGRIEEEGEERISQLRASLKEDSQATVSPSSSTPPLCWE